MFGAWLTGTTSSLRLCSFAALSFVRLTDPTNNLLGRRGTIFLCGVFCTLPVIGSAFTQTWEQLFICRLLLGIGAYLVLPSHDLVADVRNHAAGMGMKATTVPVFAYAEPLSSLESPS